MKLGLTYSDAWKHNIDAILIKFLSRIKRRFFVEKTDQWEMVSLFPIIKAFYILSFNIWKNGHFNSYLQRFLSKFIFPSANHFRRQCQKKVATFRIQKWCSRWRVSNGVIAFGISVVISQSRQKVRKIPLSNFTIRKPFILLVFHKYVQWEPPSLFNTQWSK